ncbi:antibiotic biosynthesis monooxygenase [Methylocystis sp. H62]|uniref:putative quinol monooxygenase n=1 Tax=Methylocystis sp. H62 TaxID=2785789 RepID=UPI0018C33521|nr:antibiotic biosynthesis monooxygenase [Methylocystis sp. H62]MBG0792162.1 antibiotic biosynthesis monooxygenase [Methylocystis sp. H62]
MATLEAKIGKEHEVAAFLKSALPLVEAELGTVSWFAIRMSSTTFGIFDVFHDEASRDAHLAGDAAKALMVKAPELFSQPPKIEKVDVLASTLS